LGEVRLTRRRWVDAFCVAGVALIPLFATAATYSTALAEAQPSVVASSSPDRSGARRLNGLTAYGDLHVHLRDATNVKRVRWHLDDPTLSKQPLRIAGRTPFDLAGRLSNGQAVPFSMVNLTHGTHLLIAAVEFSDGKTRLLRSRFSVQHLFVSPAGSKDAPCSQSAPCGSLDHAYRLARLGQVVELAGGSYPTETLRAPPKSGEGMVVFRPSPGARVALGNLRAEGLTNFELRDVTTQTWYLLRVANVTIRNVQTRLFFVRTSNNVRVLGGSVGGIQDAASPTIGTYEDSDPPSTDILIDGVYFHDIGRQNVPGGHVECLFIQESVRVTVRNSRFTRCDIMDVFLEDRITGVPPRAVTIENNWFDAPTGGGHYAVYFRWDPGDVIRDHVFRYNSINGSMIFDNGQYENVRVIGNVGHISTCQTGVTFGFNVWDNRACSRTDRVAKNVFRGPSTFDLTPKPKSPLVNAGDPTFFPPFDIKGTRRPIGKRPDAGAVEIG
jgi:hypothetical protein